MSGGRELPELPSLDVDRRDLVTDPGFWQAYYEREQGAPWDAGTPAPPLQSLWQRTGCAPGSMLVLGCGTGADAVAFAQLGNTVTAVDIAPAAVEATRVRAAEAGVELEAVQGDVCALPAEWAGRFDYAVERTCYCAISPDARDAYVAEAARVLKPGGMLLAVLFNHGHPGGPPFNVSREDVETRFPAHFEIRSLETAPDSWERLAGKELVSLMVKKGA